jgi:hypothetical protein
MVVFLIWRRGEGYRAKALLRLLEKKIPAVLSFLHCITPNFPLSLREYAGVKIYPWQNKKKTAMGLLFILAEEGRFELPLQISPY